MNVCAVCEIWVKRKAQNLLCVAMASDVLFILRSRLLLNSAWSGVNRVQVVLSGFSVIVLYCHGNIVCMYGCMYFLAALVLVCVDVALVA